MESYYSPGLEAPLWFLLFTAVAAIFFLCSARISLETSSKLDAIQTRLNDIQTVLQTIQSNSHSQPPPPPGNIPPPPPPPPPPMQTNVHLASHANPVPVKNPLASTTSMSSVLNELLRKTNRNKQKSPSAKEFVDNQTSSPIEHVESAAVMDHDEASADTTDDEEINPRVAVNLFRVTPPWDHAKKPQQDEEPAADTPPMSFVQEIPTIRLRRSNHVPRTPGGTPKIFL